jgi:transposase
MKTAQTVFAEIKIFRQLTRELEQDSKRIVLVVVVVEQELSSKLCAIYL